jgi:hypothetical protein
MVGHVLVLEPTQTTTEPAHFQAGEVVLDVVVLVDVGGVSFLGLDAIVIGGNAFTNPGADISAFLGLFSWLGHYYTFELFVF